MISSMTAFSRAQANGDWGEATWELRAVNHRYLDLSFRLPDAFRVLEPEFRRQVSDVLGRGKVELTLRYTPGPDCLPRLQLNEGYAKQLADLVEALPLPSSEVNALEFLKWPDVMTVSADVSPEVNRQIQKSLDDALGAFSDVRAEEGARLKACILDRLAAMKREKALVEAKMPDVIAGQTEKMRQKLADTAVDADAQRFEQELVFWLQKLDISEELDRLAMHLDEVENVLEKGGPVGRRLDFLMQELNRETNTIGSKSANKAVTASTVEMKVLIEQMREQIQNLE